MKIVIVGGVAGGATAAARLRRLNERADILLFEKGEHISFANCGLPYYIGGEIADESDLLLQTPEGFCKRYRVDARVFQEVAAIDRAGKTVSVRNLRTGETYSEPYDYLLLAPGAEPMKPEIPGLSAPNVFTLRNVSDAVRVKNYARETGAKTAAIIGAGPIGLEMAENLVHTGINVTLYQRGSQVLAPIDEDMAKLVHTHLRRNGVDLRLNAREPELNADFVIVAAGVSPDNRLAKAAGLAMNAKGGILVDEHMRTEDEHIYAVGDAVEITDFVTGGRAMYALAGPANKQARIAADNICGIPSVYRGAQGSSILRVFGMTVASTGVNEKAAKRLGLRYDKVFTHSASHASYFPGANTLTLKTLFDPDSGKILGAQIVGGDGADKRCDVLATAIRAGMTAYDLTELDLCYAPPYSSAKDPVNMAGYVIENLLTGKARQFHWHDVDALLRDESVTLLDTRTPAEYASGHIDRFVNIPLDELRERLVELDRRKPVYLTCQVGARGYLACRILVQNGFEVYNLSGGYRLYEKIMQAENIP